jgi:hypothetical protein
MKMQFSEEQITRFLWEADAGLPMVILVTVKFAVLCASATPAASWPYSVKRFGKRRFFLVYLSPID